MAEAENTEDEPPKKRSKLPLIIGLLVALIGGGGAFYAIYSSGKEKKETPEEHVDVAQLETAYFLALDPLVIPLGDAGANQKLKFQAHLEVQRTEIAKVEALKPRIIDVLNTYLRAIEIEQLQDRRALLILRAHMLRRVQVVTNKTAVRDLLITEFVIH